MFVLLTDRAPVTSTAPGTQPVLNKWPSDGCMNKLDESQEGRGGSRGSSGTDLAAQCLGLLRPATVQRTPGRRGKGDLESSGTRPPGHRDKQSLPCPHASAFPSLVPARGFVGSVSARSRCPPPTSCNKESHPPNQLQTPQQLVQRGPSPPHRPVQPRPQPFLLQTRSPGPPWTEHWGKSWSGG